MQRELDVVVIGAGPAGEAVDTVEHVAVAVGSRADSQPTPFFKACWIASTGRQKIIRRRSGAARSGAMAFALHCQRRTTVRQP